MLFANHWVTGESGVSTGMYLLMLIPYLTVLIGAYFVYRFFRQDRA